MRIRHVVSALAVVLVIGAATGCSSSSKKSSSTTTTTVAKKNFQVTTPQGQASLSLDGSLPPGWPSGFPTPPDTQPAGSGSLGGTSQTVLIGVYSTTSSPEDAFNYYKSNSALNVTNSFAAGVGEAYAGSVSFSGNYSGSATVASFQGSTLIVVILKQGGTTPTTSSTPTTAKPAGTTTTTAAAATTTTTAPSTTTTAGPAQ